MLASGLLCIQWYEGSGSCSSEWLLFNVKQVLIYPRSTGRGRVYCFTSVRLSVCLSVCLSIGRLVGLSVGPSVRPSVRLSQDIFCRIFLSNYWWQKSDIWSQASYTVGMPYCRKRFWTRQISYFLFVDFSWCLYTLNIYAGYHKWALAHSSSCYSYIIVIAHWNNSSQVETCSTH